MAYGRAHAGVRSSRALIAHPSLDGRRGRSVVPTVEASNCGRVHLLVVLLPHAATDPETPRLFGWLFLVRCVPVLEHDVPSFIEANRTNPISFL